jgi:hypothetical protein
MGIAVAKGILKTLGVAYKEKAHTAAPVAGKQYRISLKELEASGYESILIVK